MLLNDDFRNRPPQAAVHRVLLDRHNRAAPRRLHYGRAIERSDRRHVEYCRPDALHCEKIRGLQGSWHHDPGCNQGDVPALP